MADYIDRQAIRDEMYHEAFETDSDMQRWDGGCWIRYKMFENVIDRLPSADVQPIVRCKDCKYWDAFDIHSTICPNNRRCKGIIGKMYTAPDYYCAYGERKDKGGE